MLAGIFILLPIFVLSAGDVVVPSAATMSKRGGCIVDYYPVGIFHGTERKFSRPQDV